MAGASMNDIKSRIKSVTGTMQITKAMELVATSKLRRAREKIEKSRPFHNIIGEAIKGLLSDDRIEESRWMTKTEGKKPLYIVIAGDRGLAGGYNANIFRLTATISAGKEAKFLPLGKKALDYFRSHKANILNDHYGIAEDISVGDCFSVAKLLCKTYLRGEVDEIILAFTTFHSVLSQTATTMQMLPLQAEPAEGQAFMEYEPDSETVLSTIVPEYLGGIFYGALAIGW